ncbi:methyl-accepting chemotaxis protein [Shewanella sp. NFH-SH190041]|uniref:methyl-accepting chemotaxis protein n=1 Tax=Shewanella sp. NFH-SH190041 TaxID=2950245 RepID=UPI0021C49DC2|nr:methyl-accepting chemotaxis protein [Shewanella sp. NFH-SH190041]
MKSFSLKQKILLSVILVMLAIIISLSWYSYTEQKNQLIQAATYQIKSVAHEQAIEIADWLNIRRQIVTAMAKNVPVDRDNALQQGKISGHFLYAFVGDEQGNMYDAHLKNRSGYDSRKRPWYQLAKSAGQQIVTPPYRTKTDHTVVITISEPIQAGVVGASVPIQSIIDGVTELSLPDNGFAILVQNNGNVIGYHDPSKIMQPLSKIDDGLYKHLGQFTDSQEGFQEINFDGDNRQKLVWAQKVAGTDWVLLLVLDKATLEAPLGKMLWIQLSLALIALILGAVAISIQINRLFLPLNHVSQALAAIASGGGDLTRRIEVETADEIGELADSFNSFAASQHQLIRHIRLLSSELGGIAEGTLALNHASANELQRQQQDVSMVATAITELASATQEIAHNAEQTAKAAEQSAVSSEQGKCLVEKTRQSIHDLADEVVQATDVITELSRHAQAITGVLSTIQGIAEQTNLLALNAAIEAARAGEQGRGFAVVADEVRVLSYRTQESTKEINTTIETLQRTMANAVERMQASQTLADRSVKDANTASGALADITSTIAIISDMASQIATAAEQQTQVTADITENTVAIKDVTDEISANAKNGVTQADSLQCKAAELSAQVGAFTL